MKKRIIILMALTAIVVLAMSSVSMAATKTNPLNVTATVVANCNITSVTDITFGTYDTTSLTPLDANGDMTFRCTKNTSYKAYITGVRAMTGGGADTLTFTLFSDAGHTTAFPIDNSGAPTNAPSNAPISKTVYGRIPATQDVGVDTYAQVLVATVEY
jgi:spore coat protein U-like protein